MKQGFLKLATTVIAPVTLVVAMAFSPAGAFAQNRGERFGGYYRPGFGVGVYALSQSSV
jgi:hypothetical protein